MRYYSPEHSIAPGTYPPISWEQVVKIHNYEHKTYCEEFGCEVWGFIDYKHPLDPERAASYGLYPAPGCIRVLLFVGKDCWGREVYEDKDGQLWKYAEPGPAPRARHDYLCHATNNELDGEPGWPMPSNFDYKIEKSGTHIITKELQQAFEKSTVGVPDKTPEICGCYGRRAPKRLCKRE